jgi:hypothetical protein
MCAREADMLRTIRPRRLALLAATAMLLGPAAVYAQDRPPRSSSQECPDGGCPPPRRPPPHEGGGSDAGPIIAGGAAAALLFGLIAAHHASQHPKSPPWDSEEKLDRDGPQLDELVHLGEFEVEGYVRGGWPLVFDIDTDPGASVLLEMAVDGVDQNRLPRYQLAPAPAEGGDAPAHGWYARVDLPELPELADTRRAKVRLSALKGGKPVPLAVYATGCGPEAVGSVAVTVDSFGPSPVSRNGDPRSATFLVRFHNQAPLPQLRAQITQQRPVQDGGFQRTPVESIDLLSLRQPLSAPTVESVWPRPGGQVPRPGAYDLDVATWRARGAWVLGFAPTPVQVQ